jgi:hypothetical protein
MERWFCCRSAFEFAAQGVRDILMNSDDAARKGSAPQLIVAIRDAVGSEQLALKFDHRSLYGNCWNMPQSILERTESDFANLDDINNMRGLPDDEQMLMLGGCILLLFCQGNRVVLEKGAKSIRKFLEKGNGGIGGSGNSFEAEVRH